MPARQQLLALLTALDANAPLAQRHLWLIRVVAWVRGEATDVRAALARVNQLLDAVQADPELQQRWQNWWGVFSATLDMTPLLADFGFAPRTAFLSEFGRRLSLKLLPSTPETTDSSELFGLVFSHPFDVRWLRALDTPTLERMRQLLLADPVQTNAWRVVLLDAVVFAASQISATGFAAEIRGRMSPEVLQRRPFHGLPQCLERWRSAVLMHGPHSPSAADAVQALQAQLEACRRATHTVYAHLEEHGISVGIVFRLRQLRERVLRIHMLLDALHSAQPARATVALLADLVQLGRDNRSLRALLSSSTQLMAAKVAERSAETGEHYITRNRAEHRQMLRYAAGGGAVLGLTTWGKFALGALGWSAFWGGLAAGLNYALSFVLIQLLHFTVATKQPAVTAPAMAAKLSHIRRPRAMRAFVDEVAHLLRSQIAAIAGNLGLVVPVVLLLNAGLWASGRHFMIDADTARYVLASHHIGGGSALFAAFTGVLLFISSIVAGWVENAFVLHRIDSAWRYNPHFTHWLGDARAARWANFMRRNISGLAANISLGLMLGLVPAFAGFFGLGLEVRHVTLSAGQITAAAVALGWQVLWTPEFWSAVAAVLLIGPINLAVSFYLAFRVALRAHNISAINRGRIAVAIRRRLRRQPWSFVMPPSPSEEGSHGRV